jgi:hypothetical protein
MLKIKNVRPGILLVTDAGLVLVPGAVAEVPAATPEIERALERGYLVRVEPQQENAEIVPVAPADTLAGLQSADAVAKVNAEADPERLRSYLNTERRRGVVTAINNRIAELSGTASNASG